MYVPQGEVGPSLLDAVGAVRHNQMYSPGEANAVNVRWSGNMTVVIFFVAVSHPKGSNRVPHAWTSDCRRGKTRKILRLLFAQSLDSRRSAIALLAVFNSGVQQALVTCASLTEVKIFPGNDPDSEAIWYVSFVCSDSIKVDLKHARVNWSGDGRCPSLCSYPSCGSGKFISIVVPFSLDIILNAPPILVMRSRIPAIPTPRR